ncbi:MAG: hypothetical protein LBU04_03305 [Christensenellaceae bacterium]|jgi:uncharacterized lipoprotein NlpE involved in copper resistance|nr:hypothetical protein [Christensenellaceae bacterium]
MAGNITNVIFVVDKIAPVLVLKREGLTVPDGSFYREQQSVSYVHEDANSTVIQLNDTTTSDTSFLCLNLTEGVHTLAAIDLAGNTTTVTFYVDKTAPNVMLSGGTGAYFNAKNQISLNIVETNIEKIELKEDGQLKTGIFTNETSQVIRTDNLEGSYELKVYDMAGNITNVIFVVDKIAPVLVLKRGGLFVSDGAFYNLEYTVSYIHEDANKSKLTLDGTDVSNENFKVDELGEGIHTLTATDLAGNATSVTFNVDKTAPEVTLSGGTGAYFNANNLLRFEIIDSNIGQMALYDLNAITPYSVFEATANLEILAVYIQDGTSRFIASDKAGNKTEILFIVDKVAPVVEIYKNSQLASSGAYFNGNQQIEIKVIDNTEITIIRDNSQTTEKKWAISNSLFDGTHILSITDAAGNETIVEYIVDRVAPVLRFEGGKQEMGKIPKVYYARDEIVEFYYEDENIYEVRLKNEVLDLGVTELSELAAGAYTISVSDKAGNLTSISFSIDADDPIVELRRDQLIVEYGHYFKDTETVVITTSDKTSEIQDVVIFDGLYTYARSWQVSDLSDGMHTIIVYDLAKNSTEVVFYVDKIMPEFTAKDFYGIDEHIEITITEINISEITLNYVSVESFDFNASDLGEGQYRLSVVDLAGNEKVQSFIVDLTAPVINMYKNGNTALSGLHINNGTVSFDVTERYLDSIFFDGVSSTERIWNARSLDEREHFITIKDRAGNTTTASFVVDYTAPQFTFEQYYLLGDVIELEIIEPNLALVELDFEPLDVLIIDANSLSETLHLVRVTDLAGNVNVGTFRVDLSAPTLNLLGFDSRGSEYALITGDTSYYDLEVTVSDTAPSVIWYSFNNGEWQKFNSEFVEDAEHTIFDDMSSSGEWSFYAEDVNGYQSEVVSIVLDFAIPTYTLTSITYRDGNKAYTNTPFTYTKQSDSVITRLKREGGSNDNVYLNELTVTREGVYSLYVEDAFGRVSETVVVTLTISFDFHNLEDIRNSFKQSTWYTVTLPSLIFGTASKPNIAGTYSFPHYVRALDFAVEKERQYRVLTLNGSNSYVSLANENVYVTYESSYELGLALTAYASRYISERQTFSLVDTSNKYYTIMPEIDGLTANLIETPSFLASYDLPVYFMRPSFIPKDNSAHSQSSITMTYIASLTGLLPASEFTVLYNKSIMSAMNAANTYLEGYYLYREFDLCGNEQSAILFVDLSAPTLTARIDRGDGIETLEITQEIISARNGVLYASQLTFLNLLDNIDDEFVGMYISGGPISYKYYVKGDELPQINSEFGSGRYTFRCFDRSFNYLEFVVVVPGRSPSWFHTSLSENSAELVVNIQKNDTNSTFISLQIAKISSNGEYTYLEHDDTGMPISVANMEYVFTTGGKYTCIILDVYGNTTEFDSIFYKKGLPFGIMTGVSNGGTTNNTVTFKYNDTFLLTSYTITNTGAKIMYDSSVPQYNATEMAYSQVFEPRVGDTVEFLLVLSSISDSGIYMEYGFIIDADPPRYLISTIHGREVEPNATVTVAFYVSWGEENVSMRVSKDSRAQTDYIKESVLETNGLYSFTIKDKTGNTTTFTVCYDNEVSYSFSKKPISIYAYHYVLNEPLTLSVNEECLEISIINITTKESYTSGSLLDTEGEYFISMTDLYENYTAFYLVLDFTAPSISFYSSDFKAIKDITNSTVTVLSSDKNMSIFTTWDVEAVRFVETNQNYTVELFEVESYSYTREGKYYFKAIDLAGNVTTATFTIDKHVDYTLSVPNGITTTSKVSLTINEDEYTQSILVNNTNAETLREYNDPGNYAITITDKAGNVRELQFQILSQRTRQFIQNPIDGFEILSVTKVDNGSSENIELTSDGGVSINTSGDYLVSIKHISSGVNHSYKISVDATPPTVVIEQKRGVYSFSAASKKNVNVILYKDGNIVEGFTITSTIKESGDYKLIVTDDIGNESVYEFTNKATLSAVTIALICIGSVAVAVVLFFIIRARRVKAA